MEKISEKKKKFLESIGIDINNLPPEFKRRNSDIIRFLTADEMNFLGRESMTGTYTKEFCLRDILGTTHPDYSERSWFEAFVLSKRGDSAVEQYFSNPEYYSKGLKKFDQSNLNHDTPIELYEDNGQFYIKGGNNRLSLIMMKYLAEMCKAYTEEEKAKINEKYTFVAQVNPLPKDKDIMYMINMIISSSKEPVRVENTANREGICKYTIKIGDRIIKIQEKEELEQVIRDAYFTKKTDSVDELKYNITNLVSDVIKYKEANKERYRILSKIFANLEQLKDNLIKVRKLGIEDEVYEGIDLNNVDYSEIADRVAQLVEKEELRKQEEERIKMQESEEKSEKPTEKAATHLIREHIESKILDIPKNVERIYTQLKEEEFKFSNLAQKLGLTYKITSIDDINIYANIEQIKRNMMTINKRIESISDSAKLGKVSEALQELETLTQDVTIKSEYSAELKEIFQKSFDNKVQVMIKSSKISRLEQQRTQLESEKFSIIGRLLGKGKLKQAKLCNIDLKIKLLNYESLNDKTSYSLEDSLSDLYAYSQCELGKTLTPEMKKFSDVIKTDSQLTQMVDQKQLMQQLKEKVNNTQREVQLIAVDDNGRVSNRHQANMLQMQNNELNRQIQNNRAKTVMRQNGLLAISNSTNSLDRYQNMLKEIKLSTQTRDAGQKTIFRDIFGDICF